MKKVLSLVLVLCMLLACSAMAEMDAAETTTYVPTLANSIEASAAEWYSTSENRALLPILLGLEITSQDDRYGLSDFVGDSYVGKDGDSLMIVMCGEAADLVIVYQPSIGTAIYEFTESSGSENVQYALGESCADGYYMNNIDDLISVSESILGMMEG